MLGSSSCSPAVPDDATQSTGLYLLCLSHPMSKQTGHFNLTSATTVLRQEHFSCVCPSPVPLPAGPCARPPAHGPLPRRWYGSSAPTATLPSAFGDRCHCAAPMPGDHHGAARALPPHGAQPRCASPPLLTWGHKPLTKQCKNSH